MEFVDTGNGGNDNAALPGQPAAGVGDAVSQETEPKERYGQRENKGTRIAGAKTNDSSNGTVASEKKSKVASKKKSNPE